MSTLTISVGNYTRPESASAVPTLAAGSAQSHNSLASQLSRSAPESSMDGFKWSFGGYSKSAPDLGTQGRAAKQDSCNQKKSRAQDDSAAPVSWTQVEPVIGAGAGAEAASLHGLDIKSDAVVKEVPVFLQEAETPQFVDVPHISQALPQIHTAPVDKAGTETKSHVSKSSSPFNVDITKIDCPPFKVSTPKIVSPPQTASPTPTGSRQRSNSEEDAAPPLRKLKSSLKLPKLMKSQSMSHISPKSVRFASRLEKVKMFDGMASPSTVSLQCTPLGSPKYDFPVDDYFSIRHHYDDVSEDESYSSSESETSSEVVQNKPYKITRNNFVPPKNIYDKRDSPVYLQSVSLTADKQSLVLSVMCQNLAFEKTPSVKLTFNEWQSSMIFNSAVYTKSFTSVNFDQFKFTIPLAHLPTSISAQFCIKYDVNNQTYWDNNDTKNYHFSLEKYIKPKVSKNMFNFKPSTAKDSFTYKPPTFSPQRSSDHGLSAPASQAPSSASIPKSGSMVPHYNELVSRLMSVKNTDESPKMTRSLASSPRPRYSHSYMLKVGSDSNIQTHSPAAKLSNEQQGVEGTSESKFESRPESNTESKFYSRPESKTESKFYSSFESKTESSFEPRPQIRPGVSQIQSVKSFEKKIAVPATESKPFKPLAFGSSPPAAPLSNANIKAMSYADLLQKYCFNGAEAIAKPSSTSTGGSINSSCNSSSDSHSSEYMTPASTLRSATDSFLA